MRSRVVMILAAVVSAATAIAFGTVSVRGAQQGNPPLVAVDTDDIGGVVRSATGPEAGVWVIAETRDLATKLVRIVVTDDQGQYLVPDLPSANYDIWVRGYGLVDSPKVASRPGRRLNLTAVTASNARAAAEYYLASYWLSLMEVPPEASFPRPQEVAPPIPQPPNAPP